MGKLKVTGFQCGVCQTWINNKFRINLIFRVDGVDQKTCEACAATMFEALRDKLIREGKKMKTGVPKNPHEKTLVILTDAVDYVEIKGFVKPESQLVTPKTNPELFKSQQAVDKINAQFTPPKLVR
jgi:hypothetical protein